MNEHPHTCYTASPSVSTRLTGDDGAVLFQADTGEERFLNGTGLWIWQRLDGSRSIQDLARAMAEEYDGVSEEQAVQDIGPFMHGLLDGSFVSAGERRNTGRSENTDVFPFMDDGPRSVDLSITGRCNLHCPYCFYAHEMVNRPDISADAWRVFFSELESLAVRSATLSGGEVFMRSDLWGLIDELIEHRLRYTINTNGTLIKESTIRAFEQGRRSIRLDCIQVSLDGSCPEVHDRIRGNGSFAKTLRGLRLLKEAVLPVTVRVTINHHNVNDIEAIARLLFEDVGLGEFSTNDAVPIGAGCDNQADIGLSPEEQMIAMQSLNRVSSLFPGRVSAMAGPLARWRMYVDMERARATGKTPRSWEMGALTACGGVFDKVAIHHDGVIVPCNMLPSMELGRIGEDSLSEVWRHHGTLESLRRRRLIPMHAVKGCEDCEWTPYCNGGCPSLAWETTRDTDRANPYDCYRRFLRKTGLHSIDDLSTPHSIALGKPVTD